VKCHACVGGTSVRDDTRILQAGVHVVVGTPGRVYDMLRRRALRADRCATVPCCHWVHYSSSYAVHTAEYTFRDVN